MRSLYYYADGASPNDGLGENAKQMEISRLQGGRVIKPIYGERDNVTSNGNRISSPVVMEGAQGDPLTPEDIAWLAQMAVAWIR